MLNFNINFQNDNTRGLGFDTDTD